MKMHNVARSDADYFIKSHNMMANLVLSHQKSWHDG